MILNFVDMGMARFFAKIVVSASYGANVKERGKLTETLPPLVNASLAGTSKIGMLRKDFLNF
jgi:hypothetical protein